MKSIDSTSDRLSWGERKREREREREIEREKMRPDSRAELFRERLLYRHHDNMRKMEREKREVWCKIKGRGEVEKSF